MVANNILEIDLVILKILKEKPYPIMKLVKTLGLAHKNVLNHLNKLEVMDIIEKEKKESTREVIIKLSPKGEALNAIHYRNVLSCHIDKSKNAMTLKFSKL